jgi:hypothetical protein
MVPRFTERSIADVFIGHADPAERHDHFAACIGHHQWFTEPDGTSAAHVVIDYLACWKPEDYPDRQLPYLEIQQQLAEVISRFPFMRRFTYDQFGAMATVSGMRELLRSAGIRVPVSKLHHTEAGNKEREEVVKEALALNLIHIPADGLGPGGRSLLAEEMRFLELRNGRVVKPTTGTIRSDDLWTAFSTVAWQVLKDQHGRRIRQALAEVRVVGGLPGGYHTGGFSPIPPAPQPKSPARERLEAITRANIARRNRSGLPPGWTRNISRWGRRW